MPGGNSRGRGCVIGYHHQETISRTQPTHSKHDPGHRIPRPRLMLHLAVLQGIGGSVLEDRAGVEEQ